MYTKILKPEIMSTLLPEGFPADKLSKPQYKMVVERDVFVTMRDGVRVACDVFRPDAPGPFPALYSDERLPEGTRLSPAVARLPLPGDQRHRVVRLPGLRVRAPGRAGDRALGGGRVPALQPGRAERHVRHGRVDRGAAVVYRQGGDDGRVVPGLGAVVHRGHAAAPSGLHRPLRRRRRHVPRRRLPRGHHGPGLSGQLVDGRDQGQLPAGQVRTRPTTSVCGTCPGT